MKYPFVLVLHEKHGDYYYLMQESQNVLDFAIKLLTERYESGYHYYEPTPVQDTFKEYFECIHDMTLEAAETLSEKFGGAIKLGNQSPAKEIEYLKASYAGRLSEVKEYQYIKAAVETHDAKQAWSILYNRSMEGYSYEGFDLEQFENHRG